MPGWYEVREYPDGVEFQLRASNGGLLLTGSRRPTREQAESDLRQVQTWIGDPLHMERRTNAQNEPYFVVLGTSREEIAESPSFITSISREYGIESARMYGVTNDIRAIAAQALETSA